MQNIKVLSSLVIGFLAYRGYSKLCRHFIYDSDAPKAPKRQEPLKVVDDSPEREPPVQENIRMSKKVSASRESSKLTRTSSSRVSQDVYRENKYEEQIQAQNPRPMKSSIRKAESLNENREKIGVTVAEIKAVLKEFILSEFLELQPTEPKFIKELKRGQSLPDEQQQALAGAELITPKGNSKCKRIRKRRRGNSRLSLVKLQGLKARHDQFVKGLRSAYSQDEP